MATLINKSDYDFANKKNNVKSVSGFSSDCECVDNAVPISITMTNHGATTKDIDVFGLSVNNKNFSKGAIAGLSTTDFSFIDDTLEGYALSNKANNQSGLSVYKTLNGGQTYTIENGFSEVTGGGNGKIKLSDVIYLGNGVVIGIDSGAILYSSNGGMQFKTVLSDTNIKGIYRNQNIIIAYGDFGTFYVSNNSGVSFVQKNDTDEFFVDDIVAVHIPNNNLNFVIFGTSGGRIGYSTTQLNITSQNAFYEPLVNAIPITGFASFFNEILFTTGYVGNESVEESAIYKIGDYTTLNTTNTLSLIRSDAVSSPFRTYNGIIYNSLKECYYAFGSEDSTLGFAKPMVIKISQAVNAAMSFQYPLGSTSGEFLAGATAQSDFTVYVGSVGTKIFGTLGGNTCASIRDLSTDQVPTNWTFSFVAANSISNHGVAINTATYRKVSISNSTMYIADGEGDGTYFGFTNSLVSGELDVRPFLHLGYGLSLSTPNKRKVGYLKDGLSYIGLVTSDYACWGSSGFNWALLPTKYIKDDYFTDVDVVGLVFRILGSKTQISRTDVVSFLNVVTPTGIGAGTRFGIDSLDASLTFVVADSRVAKSIDDSVTFVSINLSGLLPIGASLREVKIKDANIAYAGGTNNSFAKTINGGSGWSAVALPLDSSTTISGISAFGNEVWVVGFTTTGITQIAHSSDNGSTFSNKTMELANLFPSTLTDMDFINNVAILNNGDQVAFSTLGTGGEISYFQIVSYGDEDTNVAEILKFNPIQITGIKIFTSEPNGIVITKKLKTKSKDGFGAGCNATINISDYLLEANKSNVVNISKLNIPVNLTNSLFLSINPNESVSLSINYNQVKQ